MQWLIGIDIGGTSMRVAAAPVDRLEPNEIRKRKVDTPKTDNGAISRKAIELVEELRDEVGIETGDIASINIATAGPIDMEKGEVFNNANLGFKTIPLKAPIQQRFPGIPIHIINDCNGAVLGVHLFEAGPGERDNMAYVTISTGIGGGVVINGRLLLGKEGNAAEVGHGAIDIHSGVKCNCGAVGCWEAFSSGTAVARQAREEARRRKDEAGILLGLVNGDVEKIEAKEVYEAARLDDPVAKAVVDKANLYSAIGLGLMNNFYDVEVIYIGGSMMKDSNQILPAINAYFQADPIRFTINKPPRIKKCTLGDEVGLLGALALGKYRLENNPVLD